MTTAEFIQEYREKDTRQLALRSARFPDVDMPYALDQIKGWQTARRKLPTWAACDGIVYPPHLSMEQCSSEPTAQYKLNLAMEWASRVESSEFRVESSEEGVESSELRVESSEREVESSELRVENSEREVESSEFRVENSEGEVNNFSSGQPATLNSQLSTLNCCEAEVCTMPGLALLKNASCKQYEEDLLRGWQKVTDRKVLSWDYECWPKDFPSAPYVFGKTIQPHHTDLKDFL